MTPYSPFGAMYGVEVHANAIQTLLNDSAITNLDFKFTGLIILILGLINSYLFIRFGPGLGVLILIGEIIILPIIVLIFLIRYDLWLNLISYLLNITLIYLVVLGYYYLWADQKRIQLKETFLHYLAPELLNEILKNPDRVSLGGERKQVTILFADIRGFTSYTERHLPEEVVEKINQYLTLMTRSVMDYDGMLDKYTGDGIMAVFGVPLVDEDHLKKAVKAALQIQSKVRGLNQDLDVGIGISQGEVIAGNIGSEIRMDYTVIGDAVNIAARLEELAGPGQVLVIAKDYFKIKDYVEADRLKEVKLKGKAEEIEIYNCKG
jgi:adenylate cyclase